MKKDLQLFAGMFVLFSTIPSCSYTVQYVDGVPHALLQNPLYSNFSHNNLSETNSITQPQFFVSEFNFSDHRRCSNYTRDRAIAAVRTHAIRAAYKKEVARLGSVHQI